MGNIRAGTLMKFTKLLIANVSPGFLHEISFNNSKHLVCLVNFVVYLFPKAKS